MSKKKSRPDARAWTPEAVARQVAPVTVSATLSWLDQLKPFQAVGCYLGLRLADIVIERWFDPVVTARGKRTVRKILGDEDDGPKAAEPDAKPG